MHLCGPHGHEGVHTGPQTHAQTRLGLAGVSLSSATLCRDSDPLHRCPGSLVRGARNAPACPEKGVGSMWVGPGDPAFPVGVPQVPLPWQPILPPLLCVALRLESFGPGLCPAGASALGHPASVLGNSPRPLPSLPAPPEEDAYLGVVVTF